jgi:hypothetical protein
MAKRPSQDIRDFARPRQMRAVEPSGRTGGSSSAGAAASATAAAVAASAIEAAVATAAMDPLALLLKQTPRGAASAAMMRGDIPEPRWTDAHYVTAMRAARRMRHALISSDPTMAWAVIAQTINDRTAPSSVHRIMGRALWVLGADVPVPQTYRAAHTDLCFSEVHAALALANLAHGVVTAARVRGLVVRGANSIARPLVAALLRPLSTLPPGVPPGVPDVGGARADADPTARALTIRRVVRRDGPATNGAALRIIAEATRRVISSDKRTQASMCDEHSAA